VRSVQAFHDEGLRKQTGQSNALELADHAASFNVAVAAVADALRQDDVAGLPFPSPFRSRLRGSDKTSPAHREADLHAMLCRQFLLLRQ
jgi:hypothetical protein